MLLSMGWSPTDTPNQLLPTSAAPSKKLTAIPTAKEDTLGIGASKSLSASSVFSKFGSKGLRFVTASKDGSEEVMRVKASKTEGGEFAGLLARLNAERQAAAAAVEVAEVTPADSAAPIESDGQEQVQEKKSKKRKRQAVEMDSPISVSSTQATPAVEPERAAPTTVVTPIERPASGRNAYVLTLLSVMTFILTVIATVQISSQVLESETNGFVFSARSSRHIRLHSDPFCLAIDRFDFSRYLPQRVASSVATASCHQTITRKQASCKNRRRR